MAAAASANSSAFFGASLAASGFTGVAAAGLSAGFASPPCCWAKEAIGETTKNAAQSAAGITRVKRDMTAPVMLGRERRDQVATVMDRDWVRFAAPDTPLKHSPILRNF